VKRPCMGGTANQPLSHFGFNPDSEVQTTENTEHTETEDEAVSGSTLFSTVSMGLKPRLPPCLPCLPWFSFSEFEFHGSAPAQGLFPGGGMLRSRRWRP